MENSKIEWTDHTTNLWWGCTKVHKGCDNCYAEALSNRFGDNVWGNDAPRKEIKSAFRDLTRYQARAEIDGVIHSVFVGSMMDIFEKPMPLIGIDEYDTSDLRAKLFAMIMNGRFPNLRFLFLTKRPSNINKYIPEEWKQNGAPENVWFGTSPVDQATFDNLVPMLETVKGHRFLSIEPQLGPINCVNVRGVEWVIQGGESGPKKRPFSLAWANMIRACCEHQNVPYFFKQIDKIQEIPEEHQKREIPWVNPECVTL